MPRWLVVSGWLSVVESSPSDGQNGICFAAAMKASAAGRPPASLNVTIVPKRVAELLLRQRVLRVIGAGPG